MILYNYYVLLYCHCNYYYYYEHCTYYLLVLSNNKNLFVVFVFNRSRLRGMHIGTLDQQRGGLNYIGGSGETWIDTRYRIMAVSSSVTGQQQILTSKQKKCGYLAKAGC